MSEDSGRAVPRSLADKLNHLFDVVRPDGEDREYRGREVVAAMNAAGTDISASHLSELRRGIKTNPTVRVLEGLARFFDVRVAYFLDDPVVDAEVEAELELRSAMRDAEVREIAMRATALGRRERNALLRLLSDVIRENDRG